MNIHIRKAEANDQCFLVNLEKASFPKFQQSKIRSIRLSLHSHSQEAWIVGEKSNRNHQLGATVLFKYKRALRIYSIALLPEFRNKGLGSLILNEVVDYARKNHFYKVILEVRKSNVDLINWYVKHGFKVLKTIPDYYKIGEDGIKMELLTESELPSSKTTNIIVINQPHKWTFNDVNTRVISVKEYINNPVYHSNTGLRVFNLCSSYKYQSYGYYVSLLASARGQRIIPGIDTIRDFRLKNVVRSAAYDLDELMNKALSKQEQSPFSLHIYFGQTKHKEFKTLAWQLYLLFEAPMFEVNFIKLQRWIIKDVKVLFLNKLRQDEIEMMYGFAGSYFSKKRFNKTKLNNYKYDIAILVNPDEPTPPSCNQALQKFKEAANKKGLYAEFITKSDFDKINEFDALFIRETTSVNNHTYEFSRMAYAEGLVVIDDPWSILKCSNKIFQHELFRKHKVLTPNTIVFTKNFFKKGDLDSLQFPLVLKQPDSAFSLGITKVENKEEALMALNDLFKKSDMVVCQEFLYSEYDWRIGLLDNQPLFACKYYMSKGHWQIYNWRGEEEETSGSFETLKIEDVPDEVLQTALKAAGLIGDGLYGVDLKMLDNKVYVVEVNDNPNIDSGIEDDVLKDELYKKIIDSLYNRIEISKNIQKIDFRKK